MLSVRIADIAYVIKLRPNHITLFRFFIVGGAAIYCLVIGSYILNLIALGLLMLSFFLDLVDGDLARRHNLSSTLGAALESELDSVILSCILLAVSINLYNVRNPLAWVGFVCLFSQIFSRHYTNLFQDRFDIDCVESNQKIEIMRSAVDTDILSKLYIGLLVPKNTLASLFSNFRYFIIAGIIVNRLPFALAMYTLLITIRWILLLLLTLVYSGNVKILHFQLLGTLAQLDKKI
jgi:phosphatidylglycerophosphate synthase